jgi:hypothetical protein
MDFSSAPAPEEKWKVSLGLDIGPIHGHITINKDDGKKADISGSLNFTK